MKINSVLMLLFFSLLLIHIETWESQKSEWKGKIEYVDGIKIIKNPVKSSSIPGLPKKIKLIEDLCIGDDIENENYMFSNLRSIQVNDMGDIFVLDSKEDHIKVFNKNGKHIRTFGERGQGPGEFQSPSRMYLARGKEVMILDRGKLSYFSEEGRFMKEISLGKYTRIIRAMTDSRGFILGDWYSYGDKMISKLGKFDQNFNLILTIASHEEKMNIFELNLLMPRFVYQVTHDDNVVWGWTDEYELNILDSNGKHIKKIIKEFNPLKIKEKDKKRLIKEVWGDRPLTPPQKFYFQKHFPPFYYFVCDNNGQIYVRTNERDSEGNVYYDIFDTEGRCFMKFPHPENELIFVVKNNKAYCMIEENEEGIPLVKRYKMDWK